MSEQVVVVLATGFEEIEAVTPIDVLRRAGVDVVVAGVGATAVEGAHGVTYQCDTTLEEIQTTPRAIVLPGGLPGSENLGKSGAVKELTLKVHEAGGICAAICAAPALTFAKFGLLNDCTATCYPTFEKEFDPSTKHSEDRVVVDGNIITSRGPGTSLEFSLKLACDAGGTGSCRRNPGPDARPGLTRAHTDYTPDCRVKTAQIPGPESAWPAACASAACPTPPRPTEPGSISFSPSSPEP